MIIKGDINRQDLALYDGVSKTASRRDSTGGHIQGLRVGDSVDVLSVYGNGADRTGQSIQDAANVVGASIVSFVLATGIWEITSNLTIASNITLIIPAGCVLNIASGVTLTVNGHIFRESDTYTSGSGILISAKTTYGILGNDLASTTTDDGASLVGFKQSGAGAVDNTAQGKLEEFISIDDYGADPAGAAAANKTALDAALAAESAMTVPVGSYTSDAVTVPSSKTIEGDSIELSKLITQAILGSNVSLKNLTIESPDVASRVIKITAGSSRIEISDCELNAVDGYATSIDMNTSTTDISFVKNHVNAEGYGLLLNNSGVASPGGKRLRIQDNYITSEAADAIEINTPDARAVGLIITGNFADSTDVTGPASAGFGFGLSDAINWIYSNNVTLDSRLEGVHIEGIQTGGVLSSNSISGDKDGVLHYGEAGAKPFPILANNFTSLTSGSNNGVHVNLSSPASPVNGMTIIGNVADDYAVGIKISPTLSATVPMVTMVAYNSLKDCTAGVNTVGSEGVAENRQIGDNFASGATSLFSTTAHASMGGMYADAKPTNIIDNAGYSGFMPSSVDKFGYPIDSFSVISGVNTVALFPAGANDRFHGRVRFQGRRSGVADWIYESATLTWDGSTLTISESMGRIGAAGVTFSIPTWVVTGGGDLAFRFTSSGATTLSFNWCEFSGEYWDS